MKIQKLFLSNVKNLKNLHLDLIDQFTGQPMSRVVLAGANGTGKTTILESLFELIAAAGQYERSDFTAPKIFHNGLLQVMFEIDFPDSPSVVLSVAYDEGDNTFTNPRVDPKSHIVENRYTNNFYYIGPRVEPRKELSDNSRYTELTTLIRVSPIYKTSFDKTHSIGNIIFFPYGRYFSAVQQGQSGIENESDAYHWAYKYEASNKWKGSIESYLVWLNYLDLQDYRDRKRETNRFGKAVEAVNTILDGKQITRIEEDRVIVETGNHEAHGLGDLSSGEKQLALLLIEILHRIVPGSVILIDEPEISLHPAWQRGLMAALDKIIEQYDAQVILATHSLEIATSVLPYQVINLNDLGIPLGKWDPEKEVLPA